MRRLERDERGRAKSLVCAERGHESDANAAGWRAYLDNDGPAVTNVLPGPRRARSLAEGRRALAHALARRLHQSYG
jgi:hypothetical protein